MATADNQMAEFDPNKFPFVSFDEYEEYIEGGMTTEGILAISTKRGEKAKRHMENYDRERFPFIDETEWKNRLKGGNSISEIEKINKERMEYLKKFSLTVYRKGAPAVTQRRDLRLCLMGLAGEGKSSTGNTILGKNDFSIESKNLQKFERVLNGRKVLVVEIPTTGEQMDEDSLNKTFATLAEGIDAFLFVVNIANHRDLARQAEEWETLKTRNGSKFLAHCILVLTHAESTLLDQAPDLDAFYNLFTTNSTGNPFKVVLRELHPRIIALNNKTDDCHHRRIQQDLILDMLDEMSQYNRVPFQPYNVQERIKEKTLQQQTDMKHLEPGRTNKDDEDTTLGVGQAIRQLCMSILNAFRSLP